MGIAVSTSWNAFRHTDAEALVSEILEIPFKKIELSFNLPQDIVDGIRALVTRGDIRVISLHNFCPIPEGVSRQLALPDYFSMASPDEEERKKAIQQTKKTIDTAVSLRATAVVLHTGRVEIPDRTRELITLYEQGRTDQKEFQELRSTVLLEREQSRGPFLDNTLRSLEEINRYAAERSIRLGVETRFYYREIPNLEEISVILKAFRGSQINYWHDVGHAQLAENLGFCRHEDYLKAAGDSLLGVHLHNIIGGTDHQPPSKGEFNFKRLAPYIRKSTLKVIEAHHPATAADLKASKKMLEALFDGTT